MINLQGNGQPLNPARAGELLTHLLGQQNTEIPTRLKDTTKEKNPIAPIPKEADVSARRRCDDRSRLPSGPPLLFSCVRVVQIQVDHHSTVNPTTYQYSGYGMFLVFISILSAVEFFRAQRPDLHLYCTPHSPLGDLRNGIRNCGRQSGRVEIPC